MLHLLPIRWILQVSIAFAVAAVSIAFYVGWIGAAATPGAFTLVRWSSFAAISIVALLFAAWRWIPPIQQAIFPYLGGHWEGFVKFSEGDGPGVRRVTLDIKHTLLGLKLLLDSRESTSWTLVAHAERNKDFDRYRLYYVYLNERKEGVERSGEQYRGVAIIRIDQSKPLKLEGSYFTERSSSGTLHVSLVHSHPWWKLWR